MTSPQKDNTNRQDKNSKETKTENKTKDENPVKNSPQKLVRTQTCLD
jgi:hypothetical protein|tara:strand:+ start:42 stop:182 length:141 start_codon:yes stop_codon:yes gene_type:complete